MMAGGALIKPLVVLVIILHVSSKCFSSTARKHFAKFRLCDELQSGDDGHGLHAHTCTCTCTIMYMCMGYVDSRVNFNRMSQQLLPKKLLYQPNTCLLILSKRALNFSSSCFTVTQNYTVWFVVKLVRCTKRQPILYARLRRRRHSLRRFVHALGV